jgi:hypothetical protein
MRFVTTSFDLELWPNLRTDNARQLELVYRNIGSKDQPVNGFGYNMHMDGVFAEIAPIKPQGAGLVEVEQAINTLSHRLEMHVVPRNFVDITTLINFNERLAPRLYKSATTMGCSPDFLRGKRRQVPQDVKDSPIREAGQHFHVNLPGKYCDNVSWCGAFAYEYAQAVRIIHMALLTDVPPGYRPWYRVPGIYRPKPYGIEYRAFPASIVENQSLYEQAHTLLVEMAKEAFRHDRREVHVA